MKVYCVASGCGCWLRLSYSGEEQAKKAAALLAKRGIGQSTVFIFRTKEAVSVGTAKFIGEKINSKKMTLMVIDPAGGFLGVKKTVDAFVERHSDKTFIVVALASTIEHVARSFAEDFGLDSAFDVEDGVVLLVDTKEKTIEELL